MFLSFISVTPSPTLGVIFHLLLSCLLIISSYHGGTQAANIKNVTKVAAIIDIDSCIGKEQQVAMEIAAQNFNNSWKNHKLLLYFQDSRRESAASFG